MSVTHKKKKQIIAMLVALVILLGVFLLISIFHTNKNYIQVSVTYKNVTDYFEKFFAPPSPFLQSDEVGVIESDSTTGTTTGDTTMPIKKVLFEYIEVVDGCGAHFDGECLNVRSGPGMEYPVVTQLRNEMVLKVDGQTVGDGLNWYKIVFDEWLLYPERLEGDWYVAADYVRALYDEGDLTIWDGSVLATTSKSIIVDRSEQKLSAYDGEVVFMEIPISTGLELTPTPRGTFTIFKKTPSRYMQGPLPNLIDRQVYDLPGVPWNMYFTQGGAVIHGAYWHESFGSPYSHGCVNVDPNQARQLYEWTPLGTKVVVRD